MDRREIHVHVPDDSNSMCIYIHVHVYYMYIHMLMSIHLLVAKVETESITPHADELACDTNREIFIHKPVL